MYRRNLPHWHPPGATIFVTWRLAGTFPTLGKSCRDGRTFARQDQLLDRALSGPTWLVQPEIANCVINCPLDKGNQHDLHAFVVMRNHVHLLITPRAPLGSITKAMRGKSARLANAILGRTGQPFWQDESFDHWIRRPRQFDKVKRYIEGNPVRAGLVQRPEQWPYSSAAWDLLTG